MTTPDVDLPAVDMSVYLSPDLVAVAHGCALEIAVGGLRLAICPAELAPTVGEVDAFERLADAVLEVRQALRDAFRDAR